MHSVLFRLSTLSVFLLVFFFFSPSAIAKPDTNFTCQINLYKSKAWEGYSVTIYMYDFNTEKLIASYNLKAASANQPSIDTLQKTFDCNQYQQIILRASFSPPIWENEAGQIYNSKSVYDLSSQILEKPKGTSKLILTIHFPDDFIDVPGIIN